MKILIADDNEKSLYMLETLLKSVGYDVVSAANGVEALANLREGEIDLIISDILMPQMDGFQLCRKCKMDNKLKDIPFVFYTATYTEEKDEEFAIKLGADKFIRKPEEPDKLIEIIQDVISNVVSNRIKPQKAIPEEEKEIFKLYSERLVNKLEKKILDMETEVSERKKVEKELRRSYELNKSITQTAADAIISINSDGIIFSWNNAAEKIFGYSASEIMNKVLSEIIPDKYKIGHDASLKRLKKGAKPKLLRKTIELSALRKDGTKFPVELSLSCWETDNQKYYTGIIRDITKRKQTEKELSKHHEHLEELVKERTAELEEKNKELKSYNKLFEGRELRIKELRDKVKKLEGKK